MTKRLQVLFDEDELAEIQELARRRRKTVAAWVREVLRAAREADSDPDPIPKLRAVRDAASHSYPTGEIDEVLGDIERGYLSSSET